MEINRAMFGALAIAGVVASGGGAYLASRHNAASAQPTPANLATATGVVTETENAIAPPPATVPTEPVPR